MIESILTALGDFGSGVLWGPWTFFGLMATGILFTIWTRFTQYRAMTHGIAVVRGVYDDPDDPGAINHFQALSAALSATVGLGNIGGVALAIGAGGPGALFWMWIIGFFGMALKTVEITLSMMFRNTDDPDNPSGGAMWVVDKYLGGKGGIWKPIARAIGIFFCVTLLISTFTGGNMFQSWSVANLTYTYFDVDKVITGIVLAIIIGLVIIGGIKRIGNVAGKLVPLMCLLYLLCGLAVLSMHIADIPGLLALIVKSAFVPEEASGAFIGGTAGYAFSQGLRRALFSNEAGQGSAPIAHAAAKTDEAAREGIVGGIGPFIDTLTICTLTALVILAPAGNAGKGTWNRLPLANFEQPPAVVPAWEFLASDLTLENNDVVLIPKKSRVFVDMPGSTTAANRLYGTIELNAEDNSTWSIAWDNYNAQQIPPLDERSVTLIGSSGDDDEFLGRTALAGYERISADDREAWGLVTQPQPVNINDQNAYRWEHISDVFTVVQSDSLNETGINRFKLFGSAQRYTEDNADYLQIYWGYVTPSMSDNAPTLLNETGVFRNYTGAELTAHAFDRQFPGLGKWLVTLAAWLFAISTMISWSYYGEQGMIYIFGKWSVLPYKLIFLGGVILAAGWITSTSMMENLMDLGTGAMLWSNIPIVVVLGFLAVRELRKYDRQLHAGEFKKHKAASITDIVEGKDPES